jgi:hypothetical protein
VLYPVRGLGYELEWAGLLFAIAVTILSLTGDYALRF